MGVAKIYLLAIYVNVKKCQCRFLYFVNFSVWIIFLSNKRKRSQGINV